jgi:hypothetical protein
VCVCVCVCVCECVCVCVSRKHAHAHTHEIVAQAQANEWCALNKPAEPTRHELDGHCSWPEDLPFWARPPRHPLTPTTSATDQ